MVFPYNEEVSVEKGGVPVEKKKRGGRRRRKATRSRSRSIANALSQCPLSLSLLLPPSLSLSLKIVIFSSRVSSRTALGTRSLLLGRVPQAQLGRGRARADGVLDGVVGGEDGRGRDEHGGSDGSDLGSDGVLGGRGDLADIMIVRFV